MKMIAVVSLMAVDQFTVGTTTQAEVIAVLGKPNSVTETDTGSTLIWNYAHATAFTGADATLACLNFDKAGVLTSKTRSQSIYH